MNRLTTDKPVSEMGMVELAHNSCYAKDRTARYRDFDEDIDARALARQLMILFGVWTKEDNHEELKDDEVFDEVMFDSLMCDLGDIQGLIAAFYRNIWAQADLYEILKAYENTGLEPEQIPEMSQMFQEKCEEVNRYEKLKEHGQLIELPCKVGDTIYIPDFDRDRIITASVVEIRIRNDKGKVFTRNGSETRVFLLSEIGKTVFLTHEEAEKALADNDSQYHKQIMNRFTKQE